MASLTNANYAYVNKSSVKIPVYDTKKGLDKVIGHIYPNEMYVTYPTSSGDPITMGIGFRNSKGDYDTGLIIRRSVANYKNVDKYLPYQKYFHLYNCSDGKLVTSKKATVWDTSCRIFTIKKTVNLYDNKTKIGTLKSGDKVAFVSSVTGETNRHRITIKFYKKNNKWQKFDNRGWIPLSFGSGSMPSNRAIR